ncbi:NirD/YgiW/YdeI family stress tolerance protein [Aliivibrio sp. S4TY2]|uniref:YgiW/YdeI family stress tolerance OB fold protein n=1 Tax=unclassified Aliivibrio TaxID=2645654 RepID=UPI002378D96B|nr:MULTISPECIES: NirD/YgiW/YdeI family stress tolerance protein [unclassified Aliivibrio]MDD9156821.1 NirD/YgiW/YdeI family stress tolerance protein [Aliivibrio sp. S4TY2]MDD9160307.1 NirD/YgiW/YdeI family stress tolerance protein [Aliivibrio sp. S4TY1]MDD9164400.1 NirD/YgiW/YdeI family stress tolerance protein [Aliivibrio sp. S4MY2]MDD9168730.1 NirD/YgiW/YdeI family stress tolerance protein [Aliivibrio sp. S4MY4]MDD9184735.1 NirD/YgiW/YdeI family stress tolerance protein [Aliivibrio sp. S4MY3
MKKTIIAITAALILSPTIALAGNDGHNNHKQAQFNYTGPVSTVTVAELLKDTSMFAEKNAIVDGKIIRHIRKDKYLFSDGTTEIQIELDDDISLPSAINETTKVRLFGEYKGGSTPEIEVERMQIL